MLISIYLLITVATVASWFIDSSNMNLAAHALALGADSEKFGRKGMRQKFS